MMLGASFGLAQTPDATATDGRWHFVAGLYGWFPAISGTVTTRNFEVPIDVPFSKLWDNLKFNITGHFEGRRDQFGWGLDFFYVHLGAPVTGQIPEFVNASVNLRQFITEGFGFYRVAQGHGERPWTIDVLGGIRFWDVNARLESDINDPDGKTIDWVDGFGGARFQVPLFSKVSLLGRGDIGAGGAKLDWSASGDLALATGKGWVLGAGYRSLNVNLDKVGTLGVDRRRFDVSMHGPRTWVAYTW